MSLPETIPAPHEADPNDHTPILGNEVGSHSCSFCGHTTTMQLKNGRNELDLGGSCAGCGRAGPRTAVFDLDAATPAKIAAMHAVREATNSATDRANARRDRGEPVYPPMLLCDLCALVVAESGKVPEEALLRRLDFDLDREHCSACASPLPEPPRTA